MQPILEIRNLSVDYNTNRGMIRACDDVSLNIYRGEIVGIIGESGSGKSTMASGILKMITPPGRIAAGEILYYPRQGEPVDLLKLSDEQYAKHRWTNVTTVFQAAQNVMNPTLRIKEHFVETAQAHDSKMDKARILERATQLIKKVRLEERVLESYPHQLSGGMKQRVVIALSLLLDPDILILDEPTTALDVITQWYILDILRTVHAETGITMIFLTHDVSIIGSVVDRIGVMYSAQMVEYGRVENVFSKPTHPYTAGLLGAIPSLKDDVSKRRAIPGYPPNLLDLPEGCRFGPRCPMVQKGICQPEKQLQTRMAPCGEEHGSLCTYWKQVSEDGID